MSIQNWKAFACFYDCSFELYKQHTSVIDKVKNLIDGKSKHMHRTTNETNQ